MTVLRSLSITFLLLLLVACASMPGSEPETSEAPDIDTPATAAEINTQLGVEYLRAGRSDLALAKLQRALREDPRLPEAHNAMALLRQNLGEYELAEKHFRRAIELDPRDSLAHNNYGVLLCTRGRYEEGEEQFLKAVADPLYRTPGQAYENAGVCALQAGEADRASHYFRLALGYDSRLPLALLGLARVEFDQGRYPVARDYLDRYEDLAPHSAESLWLGIRIERAMGDPDRVSSYALLLRSRFPDSRAYQEYLETVNR